MSKSIVTPPKFNQITKLPLDPAIPAQAHVCPQDWTHISIQVLGMNVKGSIVHATECLSCAGWTCGMPHIRVHGNHPAECCQPDIARSSGKIPPADWAGDKPVGHFPLSDDWCGKCEPLCHPWVLDYMRTGSWAGNGEPVSSEQCSCMISLQLLPWLSLNRQWPGNGRNRNIFLLQVAFGHGLYCSNRKQPRSKKSHPQRPTHSVPVLM